VGALGISWVTRPRRLYTTSDRGPSNVVSLAYVCTARNSHIRASYPWLRQQLHPCRDVQREHSHVLTSRPTSACRTDFYRLIARSIAYLLTYLLMGPTYLTRVGRCIKTYVVNWSSRSRRHHMTTCGTIHQFFRTDEHIDPGLCVDLSLRYHLELTSSSNSSSSTAVMNIQH